LAGALADLGVAEPILLYHDEAMPPSTWDVAAAFDSHRWLPREIRDATLTTWLHARRPDLVITLRCRALNLVLRALREQMPSVRIVRHRGEALGPTLGKLGAALERS
jgi:hypothetical protein